MYEERPRRSLLKEFIMKLILIIIFVLLLLWLVPWPNMDSYMNALNPLKDQIFNSNLQTMKDAGITYFTSERLPAKVGDKTTLSLQKMLDMKLLIPFTDRNGNSCDVKASYVSLEKKETEYLMKVNLKCGEEEDYILVHLGCYSYCDGAICEKQPKNPEKPTTKPKTPDNIKTPPTKTTPPATPTPVTYKCRFVGGQYWGKYETVVSYTEYQNQCETPVTPPVVKEKEYEYKKETSTYYGRVWSKWSDWQKHVVAKGQTVTEVHDDFREVEDLGYIYTKTGTKSATVEEILVKKPIQVQVGTEKYSVCKSYEYVIETATTTTTYETITTGGQYIVQVNGDWHDSGKWYQGYNPPADTASTRYIFAGINFNECGSECVNHPYTIYKQQTRSTTSYPLKGDASSYETKVDVQERIVSSGCHEMVEKEVPIYITSFRTEVKTVELEPAKDIYEYVHYYRDRQRSLLAEAHTDITIDYKWSYHNNTTLLNAGYQYTGKTRDKAN